MMKKLGLNPRYICYHDHHIKVTVTITHKPTNVSIINSTGIPKFLADNINTFHSGPNASIAYDFTTHHIYW